MAIAPPPRLPGTEADFGLEASSAPSLAALAEAYRGARAAAIAAARTGASPRHTVEAISAINDRVARRALELVQGPDPPGWGDRWAVLALGSVGRREQALATDHDSAGVYDPGVSPREARDLEALATRGVAALAAVGLTPCPRHTTIANPAWLQDADRWGREVEQWIGTPTQEHMVKFGMFQDLRTVFGSPRFEAALKDRIQGAVSCNPRFLPHLARNIVRFPPPLGAFGRLRLERGPEHRGTLNLKRAGLFAITEGVSLLALEAGIQGGSTWEKIEALTGQPSLGGFALPRLSTAFSSLVGLRLDAQLRATARGAEPSNFVDPAELSPQDREGLRAALETVAGFLRRLAARFELQWYPG